jgi:hypothetical protein
MRVTVRYKLLALVDLPETVHAVTIDFDHDASLTADEIDSAFVFTFYTQAIFGPSTVSRLDLARQFQYVSVDPPVVSAAGLLKTYSFGLGGIMGGGAFLRIIVT